MYLPAEFEESNTAMLHALVRSHALGAWVVHSDGELLANHIPFLLDESRGPLGTLVGHVARANGAWQSLSGAAPSLVIFQGPQSYITPSWYASKQQNGKVVPTWNYAVVHAHGVAKAIDDPDWLLDLLKRLTDEHETAHALAWKLSDAPVDFVERLLEAIVGIEIPIDKLTGKWKVSQNRPKADKKGVVAGLMDRGDEQSMAMAALVRTHLAPAPDES
jgi:transcriptional regulator